jgi:hypothetical protein
MSSVSKKRYQYEGHQDGEKMQMCKTQGINRILYNNHRIATDDKTAGTSDLSLSSVMTASDKPSAASSKIKADMSRNIQRDGLNRSLLKKWTKRRSKSKSSSRVLATQRIWSHRTFRCDVFPTQSTLRRQALVEASTEKVDGPSSITEKKPSAKASWLL